MGKKSKKAKKPKLDLQGSLDSAVAAAEKYAELAKALVGELQEQLTDLKDVQADLVTRYNSYVARASDLAEETIGSKGAAVVSKFAAPTSKPKAAPEPEMPEPEMPAEPVKKAAKKAPVKKAAAQKTAEKAPAKKAAAKKTVAKKAPAKKTVAQKTAQKTAQKAPAKKAPVKKVVAPEPPPSAPMPDVPFAPEAPPEA